MVDPLTKEVDVYELEPPSVSDLIVNSQPKAPIRKSTPDTPYSNAPRFVRTGTLWPIPPEELPGLRWYPPPTSPDYDPKVHRVPRPKRKPLLEVEAIELPVPLRETGGTRSIRTRFTTVVKLANAEGITEHHEDFPRYCGYIMVRFLGATWEEAATKYKIKPDALRKFASRMDQEMRKESDMKQDDGLIGAVVANLEAMLRNWTLVLKRQGQWRVVPLVSDDGLVNSLPYPTRMLFLAQLISEKKGKALAEAIKQAKRKIKGNKLESADAWVEVVKAQARVELDYDESSEDVMLFDPALVRGLLSQPPLITAVNEDGNGHHE